jgi:hypothetical protein
MGGACGTNGGGEECIHGCGRETLGEETNLENLGVDEQVILKWILRKSVGMAWTGLRDVVNAVMNLRIQ